MIIPADHISFNDDGTAWVLTLAQQPVTLPDSFGSPFSSAVHWRSLDRPCDTCGGRGYHILRKEYEYGFELDSKMACPANCIDGRHTFDIEVACGEWADCSPTCSAVNTVRVSVVPGMVLPIEQLVAAGDGLHFVSDLSDDNGLFGPLPPAAAPDMRAVLLRTTENVGCRTCNDFRQVFASRDVERPELDRWYACPDCTRPENVDGHNHVTRDIKSIGQCPACDRYHNSTQETQ